MEAGSSLLAALFDLPTPSELSKAIPETEKLNAAREKLYEALYCMIEHRDLPANKEANRAIGRILANAIRAHKQIGEDEDPATTTSLIEELNVILTAVVNEAAGLNYDTLRLKPEST